jgi:uncharacterized membrane protein YfcA
MFAGISAGELAFMAVALAGAGAVTGILAGVFGVGGGALIVPVLYELFRILGVPEEVRMPLCVGTSLAIIIPTSISSFRAHQKRGAVDMTIIRAWAVPVVVGVILGSAFARYAPAAVFKLVFVVVAGANAARLLFNLKWRLGDDLPSGILMKVYGFIIGILSALMGIGGGQISSMFMMFYNRPIHQAVSTSAGIGMIIAIPGALGYMFAGWGKVGLPPFSIGFVSILGLLLFSPLSIVTAPLGVKLAHALSKRRLEIAFGCFLVIVSARFVMSLLGY